MCCREVKPSLLDEIPSLDGLYGGAAHVILLVEFVDVSGSPLARVPGDAIAASTPKSATARRRRRGARRVAQLLAGKLHLQ
jgi:hypothetical protein